MRDESETVFHHLPVIFRVPSWPDAPQHKYTKENLLRSLRFAEFMNSQTRTRSVRVQICELCCFILPRRLNRAVDWSLESSGDLSRARFLFER